MKCPNCKNQIENSSAICEWCGFNLKKESENSNEKEKQHIKPKSKKKKGFVIAVIVLLIVIVAFSSWFYYQKEQERISAQKEQEFKERYREETEYVIELFRTNSVYFSLSDTKYHIGDCPYYAEGGALYVGFTVVDAHKYGMTGLCKHCEERALKENK
jgi:hypothetical protein